MRDLRLSQRPRERLAVRGAAPLEDEELLAVLLRTGYPGRSALDLARELNAAYPRGGLARVPFQELARHKGIGPSRAAVLAAAVELARRWRGAEDPPSRRLDRPEKVWRELRDLRGRRKEHLVGLYLNACSLLLHRETVSMGTLTASLVHPREVFAPALERSAAGVIVAHNHPSGDARPSAEDREATKRLVQAGAILGIPLLDHVVVAEDGYFSFREQGLLA